MRTIVFLFFAALILLADFFLIYKHDRLFSDNENRMLQQAPPLTMNSLTSGKFMTQEENFVTDQFFLRDTWISAKLFLDRMSGKAESNNVYLGKEGYLLEKPDKIEEEYLARNLQAIRTFAEHTDQKVVMTLVPGAAWVCDQLLPNQAPVENVGAIIRRVKDALGTSVEFVDVTDALKAHKTEEIYYKSDHHWKSLGALYAFEAMTEALEISSPVTDYAVMEVTDSFSGTLASNSGASYVKDSIEIFVPLVGEAALNGSTPAERALASELEYVVEYTDTMKKSATVYVSDALEEKDKYQVFLGGNHPLVTIQTNLDNDRSLLILKDSYANSFIQFLLPYYTTITIVDPRYYSDDLAKLMVNNEVTEILLLYSENIFITDNSLYGVLEDME